MVLSLDFSGFLPNRQCFPPEKQPLNAVIGTFPHKFPVRETITAFRVVLRSAPRHHSSVRSGPAETPRHHYGIRNGHEETSRDHSSVRNGLADCSATPLRRLEWCPGLSAPSFQRSNRSCGQFRTPFRRWFNPSEGRDFGCQGWFRPFRTPRFSVSALAQVIATG